MSVWNVYVASSWTFRQSRERLGVAVLIVGSREAGRLVEEDRDSDDNSEGVGARRTIFLLRSVLRCRLGSEKGGFRRPSLGVIMNF